MTINENRKKFKQALDNSGYIQAGIITWRLAFYQDIDTGRVFTRLFFQKTIYQNIMALHLNKEPSKNGGFSVSEVDLWRSPNLNTINPLIPLYYNYSLYTRSRCNLETLPTKEKITNFLKGIKNIIIGDFSENKYDHKKIISVRFDYLEPIQKHPDFFHLRFCGGKTGLYYQDGYKIGALSDTINTILYGEDFEDFRKNAAKGIKQDMLERKKKIERLKETLKKEEEFYESLPDTLKLLIELEDF